MDAYSGKYFVQDGEIRDATILLLKDKISIGIRDEHGNPRVVYWPYDQVIKENFRRRGQAVVRCGTFPVQTIELDSNEFIEKLESIFQKKAQSWFSRMMNENVTRMIKILTFILVIILAAYFFLIPFLAERLAKKVSVSYEERLGNSLYDAMKDGFVIDEKKTAYINEFFRELNIPTNYNIRITVVKGDIKNAFAMPGGNIIVYDQILSGMKGYEDLAALLTHEFTHVENRHATRSLFRQFGSSIFLSVLFGDTGTIGNIIVRNADNLKRLSYSRKLEKEADLNGLKLLSLRKIDCNGFVDLFEFLKTESTRVNVHPAEWISSHPDLERRIQYIKSDELFNKNGIEQNETLKVLFLKIKTGE